MGSPWIDGRATDLAVLAQAAGRGDWAWLSDPRTAVLAVLATTVLVGGGRRLLMGMRARRAVERLAGPGVTPEEIRAAAEYGRAGLMDFFRLLAEGETPEIRHAAGRALAIVWKGDDLIPEEEKAVVTRGVEVRWRARRRYPRAMTAPIPIEVTYGLPFLTPGGEGVAPGDLEWSHRVAGAERAALERPSDWTPGVGRAAFTIDPADFPAVGPHRLVLKARARTGPGLSSRWEVEPPQATFTFEFDPRLACEALFTLPDDARQRAIAAAVRLDAPGSSDGDEPRFLDLPGDFVVRDPPRIHVDAPLPSDLAHRIELEFEGIPGRFAAGFVVAADGGGAAPIEVPIGPVLGMPPGTFDRPGDRRIRVVLRPDPGLGWADPDVRSLWPEPIATDWTTVRLIRR